jgi:hypothetical protein
MSFTFRQLELFVEAARDCNFRRTAERIGISQPCLSRQIRVLERWTGCELFERSRGSTPRLSAEGTALLAQARELTASRRGLRLPQPERAAAQGLTLRIAAGAYLLDNYIRPSLPRILEQHPNHHLDFLPTGMSGPERRGRHRSIQRPPLGAAVRRRAVDRRNTVFALREHSTDDGRNEGRSRHRLVAVRTAAGRIRNGTVDAVFDEDGTRIAGERGGPIAIHGRARRDGPQRQRRVGVVRRTDDSSRSRRARSAPGARYRELLAGIAGGSARTQTSDGAVRENAVSDVEAAGDLAS